MSSNATAFDSILMDAIDDALLKLFGSGTAKAVKFYLDPNIALVDANVFENAIERMFMDGAKTVLDSIIENLYQKTQAPETGGKSFVEVVSLLKQKYNPPSAK